MSMIIDSTLPEAKTIAFLITYEDISISFLLTNGYYRPYIEVWPAKPEVASSNLVGYVYPLDFYLCFI